jgi:hypothetical protein
MPEAMRDASAVFHLRTGDRLAAQRIDAWLDQENAEVFGYGDVYRACACLVLAEGKKPDLAFIGLDWLIGNELAIVGYVQRAWPGSTLVVYGAPINGDSIAMTGGVIHLENAAAVGRWCMQSLVQVRGTVGDAPRSRRLASTNGQRAGRGSAQGTPRRDDSRHDPTGAQTLLSAEELAALLDRD